jgi:di/tricarboxylate transporter
VGHGCARPVAGTCGFGDPTVIFIAALFVVSEALDATGITVYAGRQLVQRAGDSRRRLLVLMMVLSALLTAGDQRQRRLG